MSSSEHTCELCGRTVRRVTRHHLIPRARHKVYKRKKDFDHSVLHCVIQTCSPCHRNLHAHLTERELATSYNTIEKLLTHPGVKNFTDWVATKPDMALRIRRSKAKGS
ncbi:MAG TPA: hypothetical protein PLL06_14960 [Acidobacteriota bacterium]|nr:hypothetical protein [Acidobacteriota bacterium]